MAEVYSGQYVIRLPDGSNGVVHMTIDLQALAQEMGWKAWYNVRKRSTLKGGIIRAKMEIGARREE